MKTLLKFSGINQLAIFYHSVSDEELPHIKPLYDIRTVNQFRSDLTVLKEHFEFVDAGRFKLSIESKSTKPVVLLSFDDGLKQCHSVIRPILREMSIPACFFINKDFVGGAEVFYRYKVAVVISALRKKNVPPDKIKNLAKLLKERKLFALSLENSLMMLRSADREIINECIRLLDLKDWEREIYMNENEIKDLAGDGFNLGGHSVNHVEFSSLTADEIVGQIKESVDYCQNTYGESMRFFAFPFFDYDMQLSIFKSMFDECDIDLSFGSSGPKKDVFELSLQRLDMEVNSGDTLGYVKNALFVQGIRRMMGKGTMKRRE